LACFGASTLPKVNKGLMIGSINSTFLAILWYENKFREYVNKITNSFGWIQIGNTQVANIWEKLYKILKSNTLPVRGTIYSIHHHSIQSEIKSKIYHFTSLKPLESVKVWECNLKTTSLTLSKHTIDLNDQLHTIVLKKWKKRRENKTTIWQFNISNDKNGQNSVLNAMKSNNFNFSNLTELHNRSPG